MMTLHERTREEIARTLSVTLASVSRLAAGIRATAAALPRGSDRWVDGHAAVTALEDLERTLLECALHNRAGEHLRTATLSRAGEIRAKADHAVARANGGRGLDELCGSAILARVAHLDLASEIVSTIDD